MALDPRTPVIIGVGQVVQRADGIEDALEPLLLMVEAVRSATTDAGLTAVPAADSVQVNNLLSWRYRDPARLLAEELGLEPRETVYTSAGGNTPQLMVNAAAADIQAGRADLVVLAGAEAWRTRMRARRNDATLTWRKLPDGTVPSRTLGDDVAMNHPAELARGIVMPVQVYPMFETALRAAAGEEPDAHQVKISELWSRFSGVAAKNPYAWVQSALSAEEIRTPGPGNRMIGLPYPKYMNSNNDVDQAAALLLASVEHARALGVPEDRWVFPHAGTDAHDHYFISNRNDFSSTPAVQVAGQRVLDLAGVGIDDIGIVDLYSCFPAAVQAGAAALGLGLDRQLTRTGGLSFAGGPWNNYVMHAIATTVEDVHEHPDELALVWANGGYLTKHTLGVYGTEPPADGFRHDAPQAEIDALPRRELVETAEATGPATVEAYTVVHDRDGEPETAFVACLLADGRRAWGTSGGRDDAVAFCDGEWVGHSVRLDPEGVLVL